MCVIQKLKLTHQFIYISFHFYMILNCKDILANKQNTMGESNDE